MRILLDLQACQSEGSRTRGIGRYSMALAKELLAYEGQHEFWVLLNAAFAEAADSVRAELSHLLPAHRMVSFHASCNQPSMHEGSRLSCEAAALLRDSVIERINPDIIHVASAFEGGGDQSVVSLANQALAQRTWITLYDLIPLIHKDIYLADDTVRGWYHSRLNCLQRARGLLSISQSSRQEGIDYLSIDPARIHNISTAIDDQFHVREISPAQRQALQTRYGLSRQYIMYTGGIDHRKNIDGLIQAYAALPAALRAQYQLAVVCGIRPEDRSRLARLASSLGLNDSDIICTGFVPEDDLVTLYNCCDLFVFPSWHEGFGLPVLEAMACGAPVICSDCSSLPEVMGMEDAMFDPRSTDAIASLMRKALEDEAFRARLLANGQQRPGLFSWAGVAASALKAMVENTPPAPAQAAPEPQAQRLSLAYVTPLPPARTGVARYAAHLVPELLKYYDVTLVTAGDDWQDDWVAGCCPVLSPDAFMAQASRFDRVLYQMGNSDFHDWIYNLQQSCPGTVILHDCYLGGLMNHLDAQQVVPFSQSLYQSGGYAAVLQAQQQGRDVAMQQFSCSAPVIDNAHHVLVHSHYAASHVQAASQQCQAEVAMVPLPVPAAAPHSRQAAREQLALAPDAPLIISLGFITQNKRSDSIVEAFLASDTLAMQNATLVLVGDDNGALFGDRIRQLLAQHPRGNRVTLTGYVDDAQYQAYLHAADCIVQLRQNSRGESSAAVLEALAVDAPLIINAHGAAAEIPQPLCHVLPEQPTVADITTAMEAVLAGELNDRPSGAAFIAEHHAPAVVGQQLMHAIERGWRNAPVQARLKLTQALAALCRQDTQGRVDWFAVAQDMASNEATRWQPRVLLELEHNSISALTPTQRSAIATVLANTEQPVVLVYPQQGVYWHGHQLASTLLGLEGFPLADCQLVPVAGDRYIPLAEINSLLPTGNNVPVLDKVS